MTESAKARQWAATLSMMLLDAGFITHINGELITQVAGFLYLHLSQLEELERSFELGGRCPHGCYVTGTATKVCQHETATKVKDS